MDSLFRIFLWLSLLINCARGFINDCASGTKVCDSSTSILTLQSPSSQISVLNCLFINCPQIILINTNATFDNVTFLNQGGTIRAYNNENGGNFNIQGDGSVPVQVSFRRVSFTDSHCAGFGGAVALSGPNVTASFTDCLFVRGLADKGGNVLYGTLASSVIFRNTVFQSSQHPAISAHDMSSISIYNSQFTGSNGGGMATAGNTVITVVNSTFNGFTSTPNAVNNAIFQIETNKQSFTLVNSTVIKATNWAAIFGIKDLGYLTMSNCSISGATTGTAVFQIINAAYNMVALVQNCVFSGNNGGTAAEFQISNYVSITILDSTFTLGIGPFGSISTNYINSLVIRRSTFSGYSMSNCAVILSEYSDFLIEDCIFSVNKGYFGGALAVVGPIPTNVTIRRTTFIGNHAEQGGCLAVHADGPTIFEDCIFLYNSATDGSAMIFTSIDRFVIIKNCTFSGNHDYQGGGHGGTIDMRSVNRFTMIDSTVTDSDAEVGGIMYMDGYGDDQAFFKNCLFKDSHAWDTGGFFDIEKHINVTFLNCQFKHAKSEDKGGAFGMIGDPTVNFINCTFSNCVANQGGLIWSFGASHITIVNSSISNMIALVSGHLFNSTQSYINLMGGNSFSGLGSVSGGGNVISLLLASFTSWDPLNLYISCSLFDLNLNSRVQIKAGLNIMGNWGSDTILASDFASLTESSTLDISGSASLDGYRGSNLFRVGSSSSVTVSQFNLSPNCQFTDNIVLASESGRISISRGSFFGNPTLTVQNFMQLSLGASANFTDSLIQGFNFTGCGAISVGQNSVCNLKRCLVSNNGYQNWANQDASSSQSCSQKDTLFSYSGSSGVNPWKGYGGALCLDGGKAYVESSAFTGNGAIYGGAFMISGGTANLTLGNSVWVIGNQASLGAGAVFLGSGATLQIVGNNVSISGNSVLSNRSHSSFAHFAGSNNEGLIQGSSSIHLEGETFVEDAESAPNLIRNLQQDNQSIWGSASTARIVSVKSMTLDLSIERIPPISVRAFDYFGNVALIQAGQLYTIQLKLLSSPMGNSLSGELVKAIFDLEDALVTFGNVVINNRLPGTYTIGVFFATKNSTVPDDIITVQYSPCTSDKLLIQSLNACYEIIRVSVVVKMVFVAISFLSLLLIMGAVARYQLAPILSIENWMIIAGSSISIFCLIFQGLANGFCTAYVWIESIGYLLVILSLSAKSLVAIFKLQGKIKFFSPALVSLVTIIVLIILALQSNISYFQPDLIDQTNQTILVDECKRDTLGMKILMAIKVALATLSSVLAFFYPPESAIIKQTKVFRESQIIGLNCYNFLVFNAVLDVITNVSISQADAAYFIRAVSIYFTNNLSVFSVIFYYKPKAPKRKVTSTSNGSTLK